MCQFVLLYNLLQSKPERGQDTLDATFYIRWSISNNLNCTRIESLVKELGSLIVKYCEG